MKHVYFAEALFTLLFTASMCMNGIAMAEGKNGNVIIDSAMTFTEAVAGTEATEKVLASLCLVDVRYYSFDGHLHQGQLVVHREVRRDAEDLFRLIETSRFPIDRVIPITRYGWSDESSMADNNTSAFNYRRVEGTDRLSRHASGRAIDINPRLNPVIYRNGLIKPEGASHDRRQPGTLYGGHPIVKMMRARGWTWGGNFKSLKDYHHFENPD